MFTLSLDVMHFLNFTYHLKKKENFHWTTLKKGEGLIKILPMKCHLYKKVGKKPSKMYNICIQPWALRASISQCFGLLPFTEREREREREREQEERERGRERE